MRYPRKDETKSANLLRRELESLGCHVEKTHGNMYSSGLPDFFVFCPNGITVFNENKWTKHKTISPLQIVSMLRTTQKGFFFQVKMATKTPLAICCASEQGYAIIEFPASSTKKLPWISVEDAAQFIVNLSQNHIHKLQK